MPTVVTGSRQDQYEIRVSINGVDTGIWDKLSGGEVSSEETKYKPGGTTAEIVLGGKQTLGNLTIERIYDLSRDHAQVGTWLGGVGKFPVVVTKIPLDSDGNAWGTPIVYSGKLLTITPPESDSESNDAAIISIEVSVSTVTGGGS